MPKPDRIKQLIKTFEQNSNAYHTQKNDTDMHRQFSSLLILPSIVVCSNLAFNLQTFNFQP